MERKKLADLIEGSQIDIIDNCGHMIYQGMELRYVNDVIKSNSGKCRSCNSAFSKREFKTEIIKK